MINRFKAFAAASCLSIAALAVPQLAMADQWNKRTILTVNEPVQLPGAVLQPGKYVMKLMDSPSNRHVVQVFNEREDNLITTVLAIPNYRLQPTGKTEFGWWEVPAGQPRAMRAWFYPGDNFGQEFAYPKTAAVQIAQANNANVPTTEADTAAEMATAQVATVDRAGTERELDRETYSRETQVAQNTQPAQPQQDVTSGQTEQATAPQAEPMPRQTQSAVNQDTTADTGMRTRTERLPETGSPYPLIGLAGFAALGGSVLVRALAKRS